MTATETATILKTASVDTPRGRVTATLDMEGGMPFVAFEGVTGRHRILVSEAVGGFARGLGHAEGFVAWYGLPWEAARELGRELISKVMDPPPAEAPTAPGRRVSFKFVQTESTGYVSVIAIVDGKARDVVRAGRGRLGRFDEKVGQRPVWVRVRKLPAFLAKALTEEGVVDRARNMVMKWRKS